MKQVEDDENETVFLRRRAIRATTDLIVGTVITRDHMTVLRPCPADGLPPYLIEELIGKQVIHNIKVGEHLRWTSLE